MTDNREKDSCISGFKAFFKKIAEKIDKAMEEKAKSKPCCCDGDKTDQQKEGSCCNRP